MLSGFKKLLLELAVFLVVWFIVYSIMMMSCSMAGLILDNKLDSITFVGLWLLWTIFIYIVTLIVRSDLS